MMSGKNKTSIIEELCNQNGIKIQQIVTCIRLQQLHFSCVSKSNIREVHKTSVGNWGGGKNCTAEKKIFFGHHVVRQSPPSLLLDFFLPPPGSHSWLIYNVILHITGFKDSYSCKPFLFFFVGSGTSYILISLFHATTEKISAEIM